jgi:hypothetical protein
MNERKDVDAQMVQLALDHARRNGVDATKTLDRSGLITTRRRIAEIQIGMLRQVIDYLVRTPVHKMAEGHTDAETYRSLLIEELENTAAVLDHKREI